MRRAAPAGALLIALAVLLGLVGTASLDAALLARIALVRGETPAFAITLAQGLTRLGDPPVRIAIAAILGLWLLIAGGWRDALVLALGTAAAALATSALKEAFARARPHVVAWLDHPTNASFPSGHAANTTAILLLAALLSGRRDAVTVALIVAVGVGVSRPLLGVHWPSDVVGGWLLGGGLALLAYAGGQALGSGARPGRRR